MKHYIMAVVLIIVVLLILFYPFKVTIFNQDNYLFINVNGFVNLKLNLFVFLNNKPNLNKTKANTGFKLIKKIKIKEVDLKLQGLNFDYRINGGYFGLLYAMFGFLNSICKAKDIKLNYDFKYQGDKSIEFRSVIRARLTNVVKVFQGI